MLGFSPLELRTIKPLSTAIKIQDFLDTLPVNFEEEVETLMSPRQVLETRKAHCMEAALFAAAVLWAHGREPLLLDLKSLPFDDEHVIALYKEGGYWGAISKSNHAALRFRDPIYKTPREIALSYYHEYFDNKTSKKSLDSYSRVFNLKTLGEYWVTTKENLWEISEKLDTLPHYFLVPKKNKKFIRKPDAMERRTGLFTEWQSKTKNAPHMGRAGKK